MIKTHLIEIFSLLRYQIGIEVSLLMGIGIKNLGFGFALIIDNKTLKGVLKQI
ncbi:hypothetical protein HpBT143_00660 [Helicobacter pylori]